MTPANPSPDARSAVLPDGRDMHPEPQELHGGLHRQQRRGPAPPRARRMVGVAGEAGRRRAPSRGTPHGRGRVPDGGAPAERSPRGVLRPVLRPARNRRPGALSGRAQRDRTAEPEAGGGAARAGTRRRRVHEYIIQLVIQRRRHIVVPGVGGWIRENLRVLVPGGVARASHGGFFRPSVPGTGFGFGFDRVQTHVQTNAGAPTIDPNAGKHRRSSRGGRGSRAARARRRSAERAEAAGLTSPGEDAGAGGE